MTERFQIFVEISKDEAWPEFKDVTIHWEKTEGVAVIDSDTYSLTLDADSKVTVNGVEVSEEQA